MLAQLQKLGEGVGDWLVAETLHMQHARDQTQGGGGLAWVATRRKREVSAV